MVPFRYLSLLLLLSGAMAAYSVPAKAAAPYKHERKGPRHIDKPRKSLKNDKEEVKQAAASPTPVAPTPISKPVVTAAASVETPTPAHSAAPEPTPVVVVVAPELVIASNATLIETPEATVEVVVEIPVVNEPEATETLKSDSVETNLVDDQDTENNEEHWTNEQVAARIAFDALLDKLELEFAKVAEKVLDESDVARNYARLFTEEPDVTLKAFVSLSHLREDKTQVEKTKEQA